MPRVCTVCAHPKRTEIDAALVSGDSFRNIAQRFALGHYTVRRHHADHLPAALTKATEATEVAQADTLLAQVRDLQSRALAILDAAEAQGDLRTALGAIREARQSGTAGEAVGRARRTACGQPGNGAGMAHYSRGYSDGALSVSRGAPGCRRAPSECGGCINGQYCR
jgi:hypothetical protein